MEITNSTGISTPTTTVAAGNSANAITSDFETFLRMLTVQLENQDPLNPVESSDYAVQLATFSGVEQQVQTNDLLSQIVGNNAASGLAQLAGWVGQEARVQGVGHFNGAAVTVAPPMVSDTDTAQLLVRSSIGVEVYRAAIPLDGEPVLWDGTDGQGNTLPVGTYQFDIVSIQNGAAISEQRAEVYSRVSEVRSEKGQSLIVLQGGTAIASDEVIALREPPSTP